MSTTTTKKKTSAAPPPDPKPPTAKIIGGIVTLVLVIAAVIAIVSSGGDDSEEDATATTVAATGCPPPATPAPDAPAPAANIAPAEIQTVTVTGTALAALTDPADDPARCQVAPALSGHGLDGTAITTASDSPRLLVFLAHWCPHCRREVPRLVEWSTAGQVPAGLEVIGIATGTDERRDNYPPSDWLAEEQWPFPVLADDVEQNAARAMGISAYPFFVLLDAEGQVLLRDSGEIDPVALTARIQQLLA